MSDFISAMSNVQNRDARTENGAVTLRSTKSDLLDFFSTAGAFRTRSEEDIEMAFSAAFAENKLLALKALFYLRDVRGGQGERRLFRVCIKWLAKNYPEILKKNFDNIPFFGRWDDAFYDSSMVDMLSAQLCEAAAELSRVDPEPEFHMLALAKWLPSENTSSRKTVALAKHIRKLLGVSAKSYRKMLSDARKKLGIVERAMSAQQWSDINFEKVPSRASLLYRKAFHRHDEDRYKDYISKVEKGEAKFNAGVTYPYEIVREYLIKCSGKDSTLEAAWNSLPDYMVEGERMLVMADVSGSMNNPNQLPLAVSLSLAMYAAERNKDSVFHNHFMTFSERPELVKIRGETLYQKVQLLQTARWGMNTNLQAAFDLILRTAVDNQLSADKMPTKLVVVSDMEFDDCGSSRTNFEAIKQKFANASYEMPTLVFWNVNARNSYSPVEFDQQGVMLVSGCSPTIFKNLMASKTTTPYDLMLEVLEAPRYERVIV